MPKAARKNRVALAPYRVHRKGNRVVATKALTLTIVLAASVAVALFLQLRAPRTTADGPVVSFMPAPALPKFNFVPLDKRRRVPDIGFADGEGRQLNLADFRGRLVLLNLWATWCAPCRREMPALDRLQAALGGPDFEVVALSIDRQGVSVVRDFFEKLKLEALAIYIDRSAKAEQTLSVVGIPTTLLIDRSGAEIGRAVGAAEWDDPEAIKVIRGFLEPSSAAPAPSAMGKDLLSADHHSGA